LPAVEGTIGRPLSPYAASKRIDEVYAVTMKTSYGLDTNGLRYFNIFGARQDPSGPYAAVIPIWAKAMANGETLYINGDGENTRDFCHVSNVVQANLLAATVEDEQAVNQVYNIGLGERTSLNELYAQLKAEVQRERPETEVPEPVYRDFRPGDIRHSFANTEKARNLLGFEPETGLEEGLKKSVRWYLENL
jgi:UDP-N-acetylglucosamine 4-epimerase